MAASVRAALLAYDDFGAVGTGQYNSTLHAATNGFGWREPWVVQASANFGYSIIGDLNKQMVYVDGINKILITNGMFAAGGDAYTAAGRRLDVRESWESPNQFTPYTNMIAGTAYIGKKGTELWFSALVHQQANNNDYRLSLHCSHIAWGTATPWVSIKPESGVWTLQAKGANNDDYSDSTGIARDVNKTFLMVVRMAFGEGNDVIDLFVNPASIGGTPPATPDASVTVTDDLRFRSFRFYPGSGQNSGYLDEVRIGETYADVTPPVPEPAGVLLALGGVLALRRVR
jgi:hypothetical protein